MEPEIVYLIVCDEVEIDAANLHRVNLRGLLARLWSKYDPPFPVMRPEFCAFVMFIGGQGPIQVAVRVVSDATGRSIFRGAPRKIRFAGRPSDLKGAVFRIRRCTFPSAGLYWIECLANQVVIGRQRLWVLPSGSAP